MIGFLPKYLEKLSAARQQDRRTAIGRVSQMRTGKYGGPMGAGRLEIFTQEPSLFTVAYNLRFSRFNARILI